MQRSWSGYEEVYGQKGRFVDCLQRMVVVSCYHFVVDVGGRRLRTAVKRHGVFTKTKFGRRFARCRGAAALVDDPVSAPYVRIARRLV